MAFDLPAQFLDPLLASVLSISFKTSIGIFLWPELWPVF